MEKVEIAGTIDCTPTWSGILAMLLYAYENSNEKGRKIASGELARMAEAADKYNALAKEGKANA